MRGLSAVLDKTRSVGARAPCYDPTRHFVKTQLAMCVCACVIECLFYGGGGGGVFPKVDSAASQQMRLKLPAGACNVSRHTTSLVSAESARHCSLITVTLMMIK